MSKAQHKPPGLAPFWFYLAKATEEIAKGSWGECRVYLGEKGEEAPADNPDGSPFLIEGWGRARVVEQDSWVLLMFIGGDWDVIPLECLAP